MNPDILAQCSSASLLKQIFSMIYDGFLIAAILFIATAVLLPLNQGEALGGVFYSLYLLLLIFVFYSWFWNKSGQTLGMKVWKIRIINDYGLNPSWPLCFLRLTMVLLPSVLFILLNRRFLFTDDTAIEASIAFILFAQGYLWRIFTPHTMHDHLSQTRIVDIAKLSDKK